MINGMNTTSQQTPLSQHDCVDIKKQLKSSFDLFSNSASCKQMINFENSETYNSNYRESDDEFNRKHEKRLKRILSESDLSMNQFLHEMDNSWDLHSNTNLTDKLTISNVSKITSQFNSGNQTPNTFYSKTNSQTGSLCEENHNPKYYYEKCPIPEHFSIMPEFKSQDDYTTE
jgi:hypothetical protein